jgi:hypothetical protein
MQIALARHGTAAVRELHFIVHPPAALKPPGEVALPLKPAAREIKRLAILAHRSQVALSRKRFLSYADGSELFHHPGTLAREQRPHPWRAAQIDAGALHLDLAHTGSARLLLAIEGVGGQKHRWHCSVPGTGPAATVVDAHTQQRIGEAAVQRTNRSLSIRIPLAGLPPGSRVFVKFAKRRLFFDQTGWIEATGD